MRALAAGLTEAEQQTTLADSRVADQQELKEEVTVGRRGGRGRGRGRRRGPRLGGLRRERGNPMREIEFHIAAKPEHSKGGRR